MRLQGEGRQYRINKLSYRWDLKPVFTYSSQKAEDGFVSPFVCSEKCNESNRESLGTPSVLSNHCHPWESAQGEDTSKHGQLASGCFPSLPAAQDSKQQWTLIHSAHPPDVSPQRWLSASVWRQPAPAWFHLVPLSSRMTEGVDRSC